jgi:type II secretory pathway pseudopilin PulG
MGTIDERRTHDSGGINLGGLKAEILSALSSVGRATTAEELQQANAAYKKALSAARSMGYRPHIRAADGQQIHLDWVAIDTATFCEART